MSLIDREYHAEHRDFRPRADERSGLAKRKAGKKRCCLRVRNGYGTTRILDRQPVLSWFYPSNGTKVPKFWNYAERSGGRCNCFSDLVNVFLFSIAQKPPALANVNDAIGREPH